MQLWWASAPPHEQDVFGEKGGCGDVQVDGSDEVGGSEQVGGSAEVEGSGEVGDLVVSSPRGQGDFVAEEPLSDSRPCCRRCGNLGDPWTGQRLNTKSSGLYSVCQTCNLKGVQLHRSFGAWPPATFKSMMAKEKEVFWRDLGQQTSQGQVEQFVVQGLFLVKSNMEESTIGGEYLPLSVFVNRGYDGELIKAKCTDTFDDEIFGTVYRVKVTGMWAKSIEGMVREELYASRKPKLDVGSSGSPGGVGNGNSGLHMFGVGGIGLASGEADDPSVDSRSSSKQTAKKPNKNNRFLQATALHRIQAIRQSVATALHRSRAT